MSDQQRLTNFFRQLDLSSEPGVVANEILENELLSSYQVL